MEEAFLMKYDKIRLPSFEYIHDLVSAKKISNRADGLTLLYREQIMMFSIGVLQSKCSAENRLRFLNRLKEYLILLRTFNPWSLYSILCLLFTLAQLGNGQE